MLSEAVAFITGGGRGIGRETALALARAGARIVVAARSLDQVEAVAREVVDTGGEALSVVCDVASSSSVAAAVARARDRFGHIDVLVNNAGFVESVPFARLDEELWSRTISVNLTGTYLCTRAVLPGMMERQRGRIINIASVAGRVGFPYVSAYCAAKHGVLGLTRALALEVATKGITVNAICPGYVDTAMTSVAVARIADKTGRPASDVRHELEAMNPQRRLIQPAEVAAVALFLASEQAAGITGQAITVDGGSVTA